MTTAQQEQWLIAGQLAGAKHSLDEAEVAFEMTPEGRSPDRTIRKVIDALADVRRAVVQLDARLARLEGGE